MERFSSISFASLRASSTGWTFARKARPKTPSKIRSSLCSIARSTWLNLPGAGDAKRRKARDCDGTRRERDRERERRASGEREDSRGEHPRAERGAPAEPQLDDGSEREGDSRQHAHLEEEG